MKKIQLPVLITMQVILVVLFFYLLFNEKDTPQNQPIDYEMYEQRFDSIDKRFEIRDAKDLKQDTIINSIKFQIVTDEKTIRNATNDDVDSIFNAMVTRQRKSGVH